MRTNTDRPQKLIYEFGDFRLCPSKRLLLTGGNEIVALQEDQAVIKLSTWTDDLGWCCQKTFALDAEMLDELHTVIAAARLKLKRDRIESGGEVAHTKVLQFPNLH